MLGPFLYHRQEELTQFVLARKLLTAKLAHLAQDPLLARMT